MRKDLFFFSSRRRHTRYWRDWSSDVCSSDLLHAYGLPGETTRVLDLFAGTGALGLEALSRGASYALFVEEGVECRRSEERRVGKECRSRWSPYHYKKIHSGTHFINIQHHEPY